MSSTEERESVQERELESNSLLAAVKENGVLHDFSERGPFEALLVPVESVLCSSRLSPYLRLKRPELEEIQSEQRESNLEQQQHNEPKMQSSEISKSTPAKIVKSKDTHVKWWDEKEEETNNDKLSNITVSEYYEIADVLRHFLRYHLIHFDRANGSCFTTAIGHRGEFSELLDSVQRYGRLDKSNVVADADPLIASTWYKETALQQEPEMGVDRNGPSDTNNVNSDNNNNKMNNNSKSITSEVKENVSSNINKNTTANDQIKEYHPLRLQLFFIDNVLMEKHEVIKLQNDLSSIMQSEKKQKIFSNVKHMNSNISSSYNKFSHTHKSNSTSSSSNNNHVIYSSKKNLHVETADNNKPTSTHVESNAPSSVVNNLLTRISKQPMLSSPPMQRHKIMWPPPPPQASSTSVTPSSTSTLENLFVNNNYEYSSHASKAKSESTINNSSDANKSNQTVHTHHKLESAEKSEEEKLKEHLQEEEKCQQQEHLEKLTSATPDAHCSSNAATVKATAAESPSTVMNNTERDEMPKPAECANNVEVANNYNSDGEDDIVVIDDFTPYVTKTNREDTEHIRAQVNTHEYSQESIENYRRVVAIDNEVYYDEFAQLMIQRECEKLSHLVTGFVLRGQSEERIFHSNQPFVRLMNRCLREIQNLHFSEDLPHKQTVLAEGIEKYVTTKLYRFIFDVSAQEATINNKLQQRLSELNHLTALELDALAEVEHKYMWGQAMFELDAMNFFRTPRDKLRCGMRACEMLSLAVGEILTTRKQERKQKEELEREVIPEAPSSHVTMIESQDNVKTEKGDDISGDNNKNDDTTTTTNFTTNNATITEDDATIENRANKAVNETVTSPTTSITSPRDPVAVAFGADEFLPCFMLLVLRAKPLNFYQNIHYINKYRTEWLRSDEESYCLANLLSAAEFWLNCNDKGEWEQSMNISLQKKEVEATLSSNNKPNTTTTTVSEAKTGKHDNNSNNKYGFITDSLMRKLSNSTRSSSHERNANSSTSPSSTASPLSSVPLHHAPVLHEKDLLPSVREVSAINRARRATDVSQTAATASTIITTSHDNTIIAARSSSLAPSPCSPSLELPPPPLSTNREFGLHEISESSVNDSSYSNENNNKSEDHCENLNDNSSGVNAKAMLIKALSTSVQTTSETTTTTIATAPHSVIDALFGWTSRARVGSPLSRAAVKSDKNVDLMTETQTVLTENINQAESATLPSDRSNTNTTTIATSGDNKLTTENFPLPPSSSSFTLTRPQQSCASQLTAEGDHCAAYYNFHRKGIIQISHERLPHRFLCPLKLR